MGGCDAQAFPSKETVEKLWRACDKGDVEIFIDSLYAAPDKMVVNRFGFGKLVTNPLDRSNPLVERGPFVYSNETQVSRALVLRPLRVHSQALPDEAERAWGQGR